MKNNRLPSAYTGHFEARYVIYYDATAHTLATKQGRHNANQEIFILPPRSLVDLTYNVGIGAYWLTRGILKRMRSAATFSREIVSAWLTKPKKGKPASKASRTLGKSISGDYDPKNWESRSWEEFFVWVNKNSAANRLTLCEMGFKYSEEMELYHPFADLWVEVHYIIGFYMVPAGRQVHGMSYLVVNMAV